ncbi:MAG: thioredoxin domain-containing protein [Pseudomonadota bacterium]
MKALLAALSLSFVIAGCTAESAESAEAANTGEAELYSVLYYADWCPSCKLLDPAIADARKMAKLDREQVLFVRLDLTNDNTRAQSKMLANALGLGEHFKMNAGKTGHALLIDAETLEVRSMLTKKMTAEAIAMTIKAGLAYE